MRARSRRAAAALCVGALTAVTALAAPSSAGASARPASASGTLPQLHAVHLRYLSLAAGRAPLGARPESTAQLPLWNSTVHDHGHVFRDVMVGVSPFVHESHPSTTVKVVVVPVVIKWEAKTRPATYDTTNPTTVPKTCDTVSALSRTIQSPLFASRVYTWGGTKIGPTQYENAFQRSEFWKDTKPGSLNPDYRVLLSHVVAPTQTVTVPHADGIRYQSRCSVPLLGVSYYWWVNYVQNTLLHRASLRSLLTQNVLPVVLVQDTVWYVSSIHSCCVLGYHAGYYSANGLQTYAVADFDNSGAFGASLSAHLDVVPLSHELGEWMNDPLGTNPTLPWGHTGQVSTCQSNLEVGDPLSGHEISLKTGSYTYHVQELAYYSWFYHQVPSIGLHGWYSNQGTFTKPAAPCSG